MVVAQQVQNGMDGEVADLAAGAVAELGRLLLGPLEADGHVAERYKAGIRILVALPRRGELAGRQLEHREREHVRRLVDLAVGLVDGADALVVRDEHVDLAGRVDALLVQRGGDTFGDLLLERKIAQAVSFTADHDTMLHFRFLFVCGFCVNFRAWSSGRRLFSYLS